MKKLTYFIILIFSFQSFGATNWQALKRIVENRRRKALNPNIKKRLERAQKYLAAKDFNKAIELYNSALNSAKSYPYDLATAYQALGYAYAQKEQYDKARPAFRKALTTNALPKRDTLQIMFSLAQLQSMNKDFKNAIDLMNGYFIINDQPKPPAHIFIATLLVKNKKHDLALKHVEKAISLSKSPQESWLTFAVWLNYEKKNYQSASKYLKQLAAININKKNYWTQLTGSLLELKKEKEALAVLQLAYKLNLLTEQGEILNIISLLQATNIPFQGAKILSKALADKKVKQTVAHYRLLSHLYLAAREDLLALEPLKKAATLSPDGNLFADQGRVYLGQENWKEAINSFKLSFKKGKLKDIGNTHIQLGIALFNNKQINEANKHFNLALKHKKSSQLAKNWLNYLKNN